MAAIPHSQMIAVSQLRLRTAAIQANIEPWSQHQTRICGRCESGKVDDERHALFFCESTKGLRQQHAQVFGQTFSMQGMYEMRPEVFGPIASHLICIIQVWADEKQQLL